MPTPASPSRRSTVYHLISHIGPKWVWAVGSAVRAFFSPEFVVGIVGLLGLVSVMSSIVFFSKGHVLLGALLALVAAALVGLSITWEVVGIRKAALFSPELVFGIGSVLVFGSVMSSIVFFSEGDVLLGALLALVAAALVGLSITWKVVGIRKAAIQAGTWKRSYDFAAILGGS